MNYDAPELRDRLAAEYVLGTLRHRARTRFDRLLLTHPGLREAVEYWDRRLAPMTLALEPRTPHPRVWRAVEERIRPAAPTPRSRIAWPVAAALATTAAFVLAVWVLIAPPRVRTVEPEYIALIGAAQTGPRWAIAADLDRETLTIRTVQAGEPSPAHDLELWLLPAEGGPISLGLLPVDGRVHRPLPERIEAVAADAAGIAISREPPGGSPTGKPTGPVIYQGPWVAI